MAFPEGVGFLKGILRDVFSERKGSILIIVAVALVALLGIAALVVDAGLLYYTKVFLSNAADAAALAGVQGLPKHPTDAQNTAITYATDNGVDEGGVIAEILPDGRTIKVTTSRTVSLGFARVLGFTSADVIATAKAKVGIVKTASGVVPFGVVWRDWAFGEQQILKYSPNLKNDDETEVGAGNFAALALPDESGEVFEHGADIYVENIMAGHKGTLMIGDEILTLIETEPGNMAGPTIEGVNYRIDGCDHDHQSICEHYPKCIGCTIHHYVKGCPRIVIVPVVETLDVPGRKAVELVGFAAFLLESVGGAGNECYVTGRFIREATDEDLGGSYDYGVVSYRLEE